MESTLEFKDKSMISDHLYNSLMKHFNLKNQNFPTLSSIKKLRKEIDEQTPIFRNLNGVYTDAKTKIVNILNEIANSETERKTILGLNKKIRIKLTGDGGNVGNLKILNFTFQLIDFSGSQSVYGNYTLGIFEVLKESHEELRISLKEIIESLENFNSITLNNIEHKIEFYLGGDLKFLANMMGLNAASSNYPCIWCTCAVDKFHEYRINDWSIHDKSCGARTFEESFILRAKRTVAERKGYINKPLISFIPFERVIIDCVHICLRISDKLFDHLLQDIERLDGGFKIDKISHNVNFCILVDFLENECKLKNPYYIKDNRYHLRSWDVRKRLCILANIDLVKLFPMLKDNVAKTHILRNFCVLHTKIRDNRLDQFEIKVLTAAYLDSYLELYHCGSITPYLHCFVSHLHEFRKSYGDFNLFNQQGIEKLNDLTSQQYYRSTNGSHKDYLNQLMKKRNRMDHYK